MEYATIENDFLTVTVNLDGGALHSIVDKKNGEEVMWNGECGWTKRDLVLFPFCCRRIDGTYTSGGKEYVIDIHGFAKNSRFAVLEQTPSSVALALYSNTETLKLYPYDFVLYVRYALCGGTLKIRYEVSNPSDATLYYSVGGHVGIRLDNEDTKGNFIRFDKPLKTRYTLDGAFISGKEKTEMSGFEASKEYFEKVDTLMLETDGGVNLTLERANGRKVGFSINAPVVAFWTSMKGGNFVCVEPWWGLPDTLPKTAEISQKPFVIELAGKKRHECGYDIKIS